MTIPVFVFAFPAYRQEVCVISCPSGQAGFVYFAVSAVFLPQRIHEVGAKSTKVYPQFI